MKGICKFIISIVFMVLMIFLFSTKSDASTINTEEVHLYVLGSGWDNYGIYLPEECKSEFQLQVTGTGNYIPIYEAADDNTKSALEINKNGLIKVSKNFLKYDLKNECHVKVYVANEEFDVKVIVRNYAEIFVENKVNDYIKQNINDSMSDYEKVEQICKYICDFKYDARHSSFYEMVIYGGGDCWASAQGVEYMCNQLGIKSHVRYAADDPNAGATHMNANVLIDGKTYIVEASYDEKPPRKYKIEECQNGFSYAWYSKTNEFTLYKYTGFDEDVVVPSQGRIQNRTEMNDVKRIGEEAFYKGVRDSGLTIKSITLPNTVTKIDKRAFASCVDLTTINIPASVDEIDVTAFENCPNLKNINIDANNQHFSFKDGVIYNKDKTEVIFCLESKTGTLVLDNNVKTIKSEAFSWRCNVDEILLGNSIEVIDENTISKAGIEIINIPKSVKEIGAKSLNSYSTEIIRIEDGCKATINSEAFNGNLKGIIIPSSIANIPDDAFSKVNKDEFVMYVQDNSYALNYAKQKGFKYEIIQSGKSIILPAMVNLDALENDRYDGKEKKPNEKVIDRGNVLTKGKDYTVSYSNNINAGKEAKVIITGIGKYSGTVEKTFTINKAKNDFLCTIDDVEYGEKITPRIISNNSNSEIYYRYYTDPEFSTSIAPKEIGTYYVLAYSFGNSNYERSKTIKFKFNIIPAKEKPYTLGDVNQDGIITTEDAREAVEIFLKINKNPTETQRLAADVNKDGIVTTEDARKIVEKFLKIIDEF